MDDLSFDRLDVDGALAESLERTGLSRAAFLAAALGGSTALLGRRTTEDALAQAGSLPTNDVFILNYALVLEYLQAAFYTEAERMGALQGRTARAAQVVGSVERAHVDAFKNVLGRKAVKRPTFDFQGTTEDPRAFLKTAVAFEDLAVAAYKAQAPLIENTGCASAVSSCRQIAGRSCPATGSTFEFGCGCEGAAAVVRTRHDRGGRPR